MNRSRPMFRQVRRRDGTAAPYDPSRITQAIASAMREVGREDGDLAAEATRRVEKALAASGVAAPDVEAIQDEVERRPARQAKGAGPFLAFGRLDVPCLPSGGVIKTAPPS